MMIARNKNYESLVIILICMITYTQPSSSSSSNKTITTYHNESSEQYNIKQRFKYYREISDLTHLILKYYSIVIIVLGTILNLVNFACFYRMKKRNSQNVYLGALSLADLFNIQINIFFPLMKSIYPEINKKIMDSQFKFIICSLDRYLVEVGLLLPVWIMVVLAFERFFCIMWPLRKNNFATPKHAKKVLISLLLIILTWSMYKFSTAGIETHSTFLQYSQLNEIENDVCGKVNYTTLVNISTTLWAIIPVLLCLFLNIAIIKKIKTTTNNHQKFYPTARCKKINQTTRVVILLSCMFVILIMPTGILIIIGFIVYSKDDLHEDNLEKIIVVMIAKKFAVILYETSMIVNLPIYLYTIKTFRQTLKNIFTKMNIFKRKNSIEIGLKNQPNKRIVIRNDDIHRIRGSIKNDQLSTNELKHQRPKSSSNESSSNQTKKKTNNKNSYRLRVSFQKCTSPNVSLENNNNININNNNEPNFYSSKCEIQTKSQTNIEIQEKIKALFFSKNKSESVHTSLVIAAAATAEDSSGLLRMNSERHNPNFYD